MILKRFQEHGSVLSLDEVIDSVPHTRTTALRLLTTLVEEGMLEHLSGNKLALTASTERIVPQPYWPAPRAIA
jgi:DNA-binding IclR family transcriptional regulator